MNDKVEIEEIPDLVAVNERARDHYDGTRRTLENVMWEALKVHNPQPRRSLARPPPLGQGREEGDPGRFGSLDVENGCPPPSLT